MTFLSTEVQHPSKECETLFCILLEKKKHPKKRNMATKVINFFIKFISWKGNFGKRIAKRRKYKWVVLYVLVG